MPTADLGYPEGAVAFRGEGDVNDWLVVYLPLWKTMEFVSWDDEIPNRWKNKGHVPNHQPDDLEQDGPKTALHWRVPSSLEMGNTHVSRWVVRENVQHVSENKIDELFTHQWQAIITALDQMNVLAKFGKAKRRQCDNSDHRAILFNDILRVAQISCCPFYRSRKDVVAIVQIPSHLYLNFSVYCPKFSWAGPFPSTKIRALIDS